MSQLQSFNDKFIGNDDREWTIPNESFYIALLMNHWLISLNIPFWLVFSFIFKWNSSIRQKNFVEALPPFVSNMSNLMGEILQIIQWTNDMVCVTQFFFVWIQLRDNQVHIFDTL